ncbi:hypothetical protein [Pararhizobium mangrovi]|nr:hypothetical protein [Pararhizobium mangrovi]
MLIALLATVMFFAMLTASLAAMRNEMGGARVPVRIDDQKRHRHAPRH